jgi:CBS domain-containing protein
MPNKSDSASAKSNLLPAAPAPSIAPLVASVTAFLQHHAPFNRVDPAALEQFCRRAKLAYYPKDTRILGTESDTPQTFFLVQRGQVRSLPPGMHRENQETHHAVVLTAGESFPLGALLEGRAPVNDYVAFQDTFCYQFPRADFQALFDTSAPFRDFCARRIAHLLQDSRRRVMEQMSSSVADAQNLSTQLKTIVRRNPITASPQSTIGTVIECMAHDKIGSMVLVDDEGTPQGIFTVRDVMTRVTLPGKPLSMAISEVMSPDPVTLPGHATAFDAALTMARHGIRHVLVLDDAVPPKLAGVVSERDLFSLTRVGLRQVSAAVRNARTQEALKDAANDLRTLVRNMLAQGVAVEQLTQFVSTLNDAITERAIVLELENSPELAQIPWAWLSFGSEGRMEQTFSTDQDNGLIFHAEPGPQATNTRAELLKFAKRINHVLDDLGFPLCNGNIMASNPDLCLTMAEWGARFADWLDNPTPEALLKANIFFDFRPLFSTKGGEILPQQLRDGLTEVAQPKLAFMRMMAENALVNEPPLGLFGELVLEEGKLDIKMEGARPFIDGARLLALAKGVAATGTVQRIKATVHPETDAQAMLEAFHFVQGLRLRNQIHGVEYKEANRIDPNALNELDRRILKEAFRQARKLQSRIKMDYQL